MIRTVSFALALSALAAPVRAVEEDDIDYGSGEESGAPGTEATDVPPPPPVPDSPKSVERKLDYVLPPQPELKLFRLDLGLFAGFQMVKPAGEGGHTDLQVAMGWCPAQHHCIRIVGGGGYGRQPFHFLGGLGWAYRALADAWRVGVGVSYLNLKDEDFRFNRTVLALSPEFRVGAGSMDLVLQLHGGPSWNRRGEVQAFVLPMVGVGGRF